MKRWQNHLQIIVGIVGFQVWKWRIWPVMAHEGTVLDQLYNCKDYYFLLINFVLTILSLPIKTWQGMKCWCRFAVAAVAAVSARTLRISTDLRLYASATVKHTIFYTHLYTVVKIITQPHENFYFQQGILTRPLFHQLHNHIEMEPYNCYSYIEIIDKLICSGLTYSKEN